MNDREYQLVIDFASTQVEPFKSKVMRMLETSYGKRRRVCALLKMDKENEIKINDPIDILIISTPNNSNSFFETATAEIRSHKARSPLLSPEPVSREPGRTIEGEPSGSCCDGKSGPFEAIPYINMRGSEPEDQDW